MNGLLWKTQKPVLRCRQYLFEAIKLIVNAMKQLSRSVRFVNDRCTLEIDHAETPIRSAVCHIPWAIFNNEHKNQKRISGEGSENPLLNLRSNFVRSSFF